MMSDEGVGLIAQVFHNLANALHGGQSCGNEWQAQHVFYHTHLGEHGLDTGRVTIHKE